MEELNLGVSTISKAFIVVLFNIIRPETVVAATLGENMRSICEQAQGSPLVRLIQLFVAFFVVIVVLYAVSMSIKNTVKDNNFDKVDWGPIRNALVILLVLYSIEFVVQLFVGVDISWLLPYGGSSC